MKEVQKYPTYLRHIRHTSSASPIERRGYHTLPEILQPRRQERNEEDDLA